MTKSIVIRVDAGTGFGAGHIVRCIALAQAWQELGGKATFLSHCDNAALRKRVFDEGFEFIPIKKPHPAPHDLDQTLEIIKQKNIRSSKKNTWIVLDGYHFTSRYQKAIRGEGYKLLVIDDMAHLSHYYADILLNQNLNASNLPYSCEMGTVKLYGTDYVLLQTAFLRDKCWKRQHPEKAKRILVTLGGTDSKNVTLKVLKALNSLSDQELEAKIVVGPSNPNIKSLEKEINRSPFTFRLLTYVDNMPELMTWADLAISAAGSTCWEILFTGLPNIVITIADNQIGIADGLKKSGASVVLGWHEDISISEFSKAINDIIKDKNKRLCLSDHGKEMIGRKGRQKVISLMLAGQVRLRRVLNTDCELLWKWVNDPEVRQSAFNTEPIEMSVHKKWFGRMLSSPDCIQYIAVNNEGIPVGQIRFDIADKTKTNIDYSVDRKYRGLGVGTTILKAGIESLCKELGKPISIQGKVKTDNHQSIQIFRKMGFKERLKLYDRSKPDDMNNGAYVYTMVVR